MRGLQDAFDQIISYYCKIRKLYRPIVTCHMNKIYCRTSLHMPKQRTIVTKRSRHEDYNHKHTNSLYIHNMYNAIRFRTCVQHQNAKQCYTLRFTKTITQSMISCCCWKDSVRITTVVACAGRTKASIDGDTCAANAVGITLFSLYQSGFICLGYLTRNEETHSISD